MRSTARAVTRSQNMAALIVVASGIAVAPNVQAQVNPWGVYHRCRTRRDSTRSSAAANACFARAS
jgi:hypothetical protein